MRFIRRNVDDNPKPTNWRCAFGCPKVGSENVKIEEFSIWTCRDHVDQALDMYLESRKK